jgi:hypothetical protein
MLKRIVFFLSLALLSNVLWGDEFKVRILSCPKEVIVSAPVAITAEVTNVSGRVITVAYGHGGFTVSLDIRRSDGKPLPPLGKYEEAVKWTDNFQLETIPVGWKQVKILDAAPLPVESCEMVVQVVLASHGPYFHYDKGEKLPVEAWSGEVKSEEARIQIVEPSGVDKAAYDYFKGSPLSKPQDLLAKFPASTYAGYALAEKVPDYSNPLFKPVPPAEQVRMSREEGKTVVAFADPAFEQYFQKLDAHVKGGNVPESLRVELYGFYGDMLIQRGRFAEAEAAFCQAVKEKPGDAKGEAYFTRAQQFLDALNKHGA